MNALESNNLEHAFELKPVPAFRCDPRVFASRRRRSCAAAGAIIGTLCTVVLPSYAAEALVPVHVATARQSSTTPSLALSGEIAARIQSNVAFRLNGKVTSRRVEVGQHVAANEILAVLDPTEQQADVDNAQAGLNSAEALLQQATANFERQKTLLESGYATRSNFDAADASLKTNNALVEAARAALGTAKEQLSYTELKAPTSGIIVSRDVEAGQVVQAGQTVFVLAEDGPRDAVFNIFESILIKAPKSRTVDVTLQSDPTVRTSGEVREISPTVDPTTGTVKAKVGLTSTPLQMTLGTTVIGKGRWDATTAIVLPWSALFEWQGQPAVWVLDGAEAVSPRLVTVQSYGTGAVTLSGGLEDGQRVVTAGIQFLHPGQKVAVVEGNGL